MCMDARTRRSSNTSLAALGSVCVCWFEPHEDGRNNCHNTAAMGQNVVVVSPPDYGSVIRSVLQFVVEV